MLNANLPEGVQNVESLKQNLQPRGMLGKLGASVRDFAAKGNVLDLAVGVTVGATFSSGITKIISSFVNDVLMPPIGALAGKVDFSSLYLNFSGRRFESLAQAKQAGAPVLAYGNFLNQIIDFAIAGGLIFLVVNQLNRFKKGQEPAPVSHECPFCLSSIPIAATRCRYCTSVLEGPSAIEASPSPDATVPGTAPE